MPDGGGWRTSSSNRDRCEEFCRECCNRSVHEGTGEYYVDGVSGNGGGGYSAYGKGFWADYFRCWRIINHNIRYVFTLGAHPCSCYDGSNSPAHYLMHVIFLVPTTLLFILANAMMLGTAVLVVGFLLMIAGEIMAVF